MSHYAVLVLTDKNQVIEELMAPFYENLESEFGFKISADKAEKEMITFWGDKKYQKRYQEVGNDWKSIVQDYYGEECTVDDEGNVITPDNPNAKWDWYQIGGRFSGIPMKSGETKYRCKVLEINLGFDQKSYDKALKEWEHMENAQDPYLDYYKFRFKNAETYAKSSSVFVPYAVVTPDGKCMRLVKWDTSDCQLKQMKKLRNGPKNSEKSFKTAILI